MATLSVELINPFLATAKKILSEVCFVEVNIHKPMLKETSFDKSHWVIIVGVTGELHGHVLLAMTERQACGIASKMAMMDIKEMDDFASSAVSELGNMIMGNVATVFSSSGIGIDITPPTLSNGNVSFASKGGKSLCVPLTFDGGGMDLYLALQQA
ncbi:MAG: chemotaxis protein CheX [Eubacterium sp.]|nr:chemotaxis protein CheX [Eubacterium sp.]